MTWNTQWTDLPTFEDHPKSTEANVDEIHAVEANLWFRDNMRFRYSPPMVRCHHDGNQSVRVAQDKTIDFNKTLWDTDDMHGTREITDFARSSVIWINTAGRYIIDACVTIEEGVNWGVAVGLNLGDGTLADADTFVKTSNSAPGSTRPVNLPLSALVTAAADELLVMVPTLAAGGFAETLNVQSVYPSTPMLSAHWVGGEP
jgi:hypothetical protein